MSRHDLFSIAQQAIEDLHSEEDNVNHLTKEKAKLQMQAEEVEIFTFYTSRPPSAMTHLANG